MQLQKCYEEFSGDYENVKSRLLKDSLIQRLVINFLDDANYKRLSDSMENKDYGEAFKAAHSLKGVCLNLSFDILGQSTGLLTEALRRWDKEPVDEEKCQMLWQQISNDYNVVINAINILNEQITVS
ncbi:MAG: Hpt domain-containing protein [Lachnospiraceae bacterium]